MILAKNEMRPLLKIEKAKSISISNRVRIIENERCNDFMQMSAVQKTLDQFANACTSERQMWRKKE